MMKIGHYYMTQQEVIQKSILRNAKTCVSFYKFIDVTLSMGIQHLVGLSFTKSGSLKRALSAVLFIVLLTYHPAMARDPDEETAGTGNEGAPACNPYEGFPDCCPAGQAIVDTFRDLIVKGDRNLINPSEPLDILYPADNYGAYQPTPRHYNTTGGGSLQTYGFVTRALATAPAEAPSPLACYGGGGTYNEYICGRANLMTNSKAIIDPSLTATCPRWDDFNNYPDLCLSPAEHIANYDKILDSMRALDCASAIHAAYQLSGMLGPTGRDASVFLTNSVSRMVAKSSGGQTVYPSNAGGTPLCDPDNNWAGCQCGDVAIVEGDGHVVMYSGRGTILHSNYSRVNGNGRPDINGNAWDGPHEDKLKYKYRIVSRFIDCSPGASNNVLRGFGSSCSTYRRNAEGQCVPTPCVGSMTLYNNLLTWRSCYNPVETPNTECLNAAPPPDSWGAATAGQLQMGTMPTVPACYVKPKTPRFTTYQISAIADFLRNARSRGGAFGLITAIIELIFRTATPTSSLSDNQANDKRIGAFYEFQAGSKSQLGKNDADISALLQQENIPPSYGCKNVAINKRQLSEQVDRFISNWMFRCSTNTKIQLAGKPGESDIMDGECVRRYAGSAVLPKAPIGTDESMCQPLDIAAPTKRDTPVPAVEAIYDPTHPFGFRKTGIVGTYNNDLFSKKYNANIVCDRADPANPNDAGYPVDILMSRKSEWDACTSCHANCFKPTDYDLNSSIRPPPLMQPQCSTCRDDCCDIIEKPVNEKEDNVILNVLKLRPTPFAWERDVRWPDWEWIFWRNFGTSESRAKKPAMTWWDTNYASCRYPEDTLVGVGVEHENCGYGGWEELKLYQANCMKYFRLGCICKYEQTFKQGSAEEYVHRRAGAVYWDFKEKSKSATVIGSGTKQVTSLAPVQQQWPLAWRGYVKHGHATLKQKEYGTAARIAIVSKRFPFLGLKPDPNFADCQTSPFDPEKCLAAKGAWYDPNNTALSSEQFTSATDMPGQGEGLSKAKPGDILVWDDEVIRKNGGDLWDEPDSTYTLPDMLPHVAIVQTVHPKYVLVEEYNYGEFPDS
ncbi:MAG: hypothetical protein J0L97_05690, partial [Alphaproteobacteria bacterium]|nr:hypothetical protein [Alphaproteobacteria bacterium]